MNGLTLRISVTTTVMSLAKSKHPTNEGQVPGLLVPTGLTQDRTDLMRDTKVVAMALSTHLTDVSRAKTSEM